MEAIRIILALESQMLADGLHTAFGKEPDIEVVFETSDTLDLLFAAREHEPHVVVMTATTPGRLPAVGTHLLTEFPGLLIVGISPRSKSVYTFQNTVRTERHSLGNLEQLLTTVRAAASQSI